MFSYLMRERYPHNPVKSFIMGIKTECNDSEVNRWFIKYTDTEGDHEWLDYFEVKLISVLD